MVFHEREAKLGGLEITYYHQHALYIVELPELYPDPPINSEPSDVFPVQGLGYTAF